MPFIRPFMLKCIISFLIILGVNASLFSQLKSPYNFLSNRFGEEFTPHESLVEYVKHVADNSTQVKLIEYGRSTENRPLLLTFISTPENLANLEQIRTNNQRRAGLLPGKTDPKWDNLSIVWLSFGVHGNEASCSETAMITLFELAIAADDNIKKQLKNTLVILDPSLNPDGYSRYTHWYKQIAGKTPDVRPESREHQEPWPRGRPNHYYFDLNRDWAWQTQVETQQRAVQYLSWMPQIHADFHEQGYSSPYYFAPAANPYHSYVTKWQKDFQFQIGKNHARYFDANGWLYFTREVFDLLYPSYGDTYPTYNGAIGMTYEQGGIGAGLAILLPNGDTLRLSDRIAHHKTTALSTVEMAANNAARLNTEFAAFFKKSLENPTGMYKTYVIKKSAFPDRLKRFCALLDKNGISYGTASKKMNVSAYQYETGKNTSLEIESGDLMINACQPRGMMAQILLDPEVEVQDSNTYDITAWSLIYAYGLPGFATQTCIEPEVKGFVFDKPAALNTKSNYAYLVKWESLEQAVFLTKILKKGVQVRVANEPFLVEDQSYDRGTLVITRGDNPKISNLADIISATASENKIKVTSVATGFANAGSDLGSSNFQLLKSPNVAVLGGEQANANDLGHLWFYLEQELNMSVAILDAARMDRYNLDAYNVIIVPEGYFRFSDNMLSSFTTWVRKGGRLIILGDALSLVSGKSGFALKNNEEDASKSTGKNVLLSDYTGDDRRELSEGTPGAIFKVKLDNSHPLAYGQSDTYFSLKTTNTTFKLSGENAYNIGITDKSFKPSGYVGYKALEKFKESLVIGAESVGQGSMVYYVDNLLFRDFWDNGKFLFSNALFFRF
jgi:hypothetical protein